MPLLLVPRDFPPSPASAKAYEQAAKRIALSRGRTPIEDGRALEAKVSRGAWVADCPRCRAGICIHPEWAFAACFGGGCYGVYRLITVPDDWTAIERVLILRDLYQQHWQPGESVGDLMNENEANGLPRGDE